MNENSFSFQRRPASASPTKGLIAQSEQPDSPADWSLKAVSSAFNSRIPKPQVPPSTPSDHGNSKASFLKLSTPASAAADAALLEQLGHACWVPWNRACGQQTSRRPCSAPQCQLRARRACEKIR
jgi:hypothetical protein